MSNYNFSAILNTIMTEKNISIKDVAAATDIPYKTFYNYLHGSKPPTDKLIKIAEYLKVSPQTLDKTFMS